jgi:hypothetical protein
MCIYIYIYIFFFSFLWRYILVSPLRSILNFHSEHWAYYKTVHPFLNSFTHSEQNMLFTANTGGTQDFKI